MGFIESFDSALRKIDALGADQTAPLKRIRAELLFAKSLAELRSEKTGEWHALIEKAAELVAKALPNVSDQTVSEAERVMAPIGATAKEYVIHYIGHAHIDMNWSWPWIETVAMSHDTFVTVDKLMDEFPDFKFSQSMVSIYKAMKDYCPEVFEMITRRMKEGRWEVIANTWVEGDRNLSSGESICRHLLYTKRYFKETFGLGYDAVKIDWEPDTFGHAHTVPGILARAGVTRYYHCRTGPKKWLLWWQSPDGSRVLRFHDMHWYGGHITAQEIINYVPDYIEKTGLKDFGYVFGVGDHGGGPTRRDLLNAIEMNAWPIWPAMKGSTTDEYFSAVERFGETLPVYDGELNSEFEGCYTSQSKAKLINRIGEHILPEVETISLVARAAVGFTYPSEQIRDAWPGVMFNQFHDILAGSSEHEAMEEAVARFRESETIAGMIRSRALRQIAARVDTSKIVGKDCIPAGDTLGYGDGDFGLPGRVTSVNFGGDEVAPVLVFNPLTFPRTEMVEMKVWNKEFPRDRIVVRDEAGNTVPGQVIGRSRYGEHDSAVVLFPATVPAVGYRTYVVEPAKEPAKAKSEVKAEAKPEGPCVIENEFLRLEIDLPSGAISHMIDKETGYDYVPKKQLMGVLEWCNEADHNMSGWDIGPIKTVTRLIDGAIVEEPDRYSFLEGNAGLGMVNRWQFPQAGPHRAALRTTRKVANSTICMEIALSAGHREVEITLNVQWRELGNPQVGVPMLRIAFPINVADPKAKYEIPFGSIERPVDGWEVPALRWADMSGGKVGAEGACGITVLNDHKYGHNAEGNTMRVSVLRGSYDPDPVPELGSHRVRFSLVPHAGACPVADATRAAEAFNLPMSVVSAEVHKGDLPTTKSFAEVLTPNVLVAAMKKAEDSDAVIVRLFEVEGKDTEAKAKISDIVKPGAPAVEVDIMEQPISPSTARMDGDTLIVRVPKFGITSVLIG